MSDAAEFRQKAETCLRLAATATAARAHDLFRKMADDYLAQAEALERPPSFTSAPPTSFTAANPPAFIAAPSLAPAQSASGDSPAETVIDGSPSLAPLTPSEQWLAELQALRARA